MRHLFDNGYAEKAHEPPTPGRTWYLPHFAVVTPWKPKPRIVFDAAARSHGVCLNDLLLPGPDLLQSLPGILMRFRQHAVAVTADIKEMFLQIRIREEDRDALRFLWRENADEPPVECRMTSVVFGAASSPCTAIYIKNKNAEQHRKEHAKAPDAIAYNHYMDDYLQSFPTVEEATRVAKEVALVHNKAKFELGKWASNEPAVLEAVSSTSSQDAEIKLDPEKILGLIWRPARDRGPKKTVMSLYDPLGLITPITVGAKRILQATWKTGLGWDEIIADELHEQWKDWLGKMRALVQLEIPRSYLCYTRTVSLQLHTFVDASETAYAAAVYWRMRTDDGKVHVSLVAAKGRVAPLKVTSIPRLELQAAVLGSRLAKTVTEEHDLKPERRVFWSDSRTVLTWIRTGARSYKPFVAHRIAELEESTKKVEWKWVPTKENVADDATRDAPSNLNQNHRWFRGPQFLYEEEDDWPTERVTPTVETGEERVLHCTSAPAGDIRKAMPNIEKYSSWLRLVRATGRVLQFVDLCRRRRASTQQGTSEPGRMKTSPPGSRVTRSALECRGQPVVQNRRSRAAIRPLPAEYELAAEQLLTKAAQMDSFEEDIKRLMKGHPVERKQTPWPKRDDGSRDDKIKYAHKQSRRCRRDD
ncbi:hypothetical protein EVAR_66268_1 [Eumeta japonica]|uniref:Uncharacterized protein n=1 Tax=Eumeta variegata TaxID=151549 RepID=A0A4C1ZUZ7_EUMVA|nr:hypothetical protein EVAR_66268_1 [Eumeta japonica]